MHSLSDPSVISQRQAIVNRIDALKQDICNLLSQQNEFLPVAALCPDVLLQVLDYAAASTDYSMLARVRFAQVCRHWRSVTLGTPSFWSTIHHTQGDWKEGALLQCFLERSHSADIQVDWSLLAIHRRPRSCHPRAYYGSDDSDDSCYSTQKALQALSSHTGRITSFCCSSADHRYYNSDDGLIWAILDEHPPPLVHLTISGRFALATFSAQRCTRISSMFPMLQTLKVGVGKDYSWPSTLPLEWALPHTLTSLDITYAPIRHNVRRDTTEPWTAILQQLRPLQNLQTLKLCNVVGHYNADDHDIIADSESESLTLPSLRSLILKGATDSGAHIRLLESLVLPSLAQLDVDILVQGLCKSISGRLLGTIFPRLHQAFLTHSQIVVLRQTSIDTDRYGYHGDPNMKVSCLWSTKLVPGLEYTRPTNSPIRKIDDYPSHSSLNIHIRHVTSDDETRRGETQTYLDNLHLQGIPGLHTIEVFAFHGSRRLATWSATPRGILPLNTIRSMSKLRVLCLYKLASVLDDIASLFARFPDGTHPFPHMHTLQISIATVDDELLDGLETILRERQSAGMKRLRVVLIGRLKRDGWHVDRDTHVSYKERLQPMADIQFFDSGTKYTGDENREQVLSLPEESDTEEDADFEGPRRQRRRSRSPVIMRRLPRSPSS